MGDTLALERDPLNETLHRRLMACQLRRGETAEALRTYLRCREVLAKGLGVVPSAQTERMYSEAMCAGAILSAPMMLVKSIPHNDRTHPAARTATRSGRVLRL